MADRRPATTSRTRRPRSSPRSSPRRRTMLAKGGAHLIQLYPAPIVTSAGGAVSSVTITGQYFTGASKVTFGGIAATISSVSDTSITASIPAGSYSGVPVVVTTPAALVGHEHEQVHVPVTGGGYRSRPTGGATGTTSVVQLGSGGHTAADPASGARWPAATGARCGRARTQGPPLIRCAYGGRGPGSQSELRAAQRVQPAAGLPAGVRRAGRGARVRPPGDPDAAGRITARPP